ncbi:phosphatases II [Piedraia hortae CBS 480.64]|uniref:phosphatidylinositol-3,4,5-trisphosphate 3-phosphatase n=1 Tax=Piedraia hortae CBS 480.64 TaxID=1314780 RepID=A0A6A7C1A5_9PEZI|nr:phosphatases II [Piedraia hortae CBS 480.64]
MTSLLRQIVASPRVRHSDADLDLCYVTDRLIATSGPGHGYPQVAYRNPLKSLVRFLDDAHGDNWAIWEFRAEGTGYPDDQVYNRINHYPWPDHHPPPFGLIPLIMASMRNWLNEDEKHVAVVHCKAGKGRSGTVSCSYLISEQAWSPKDALDRFTERRMRPGFGAGISIPSQLRTISYVDRWTKNGKIYIERSVEIVEVHFRGLRSGVKVAIQGYVEEGKVIKMHHTFNKNEKTIVRGTPQKSMGFAEAAMGMLGRGRKTADEADNDELADGLCDVVFRPSSSVVVPTSDVKIDVERRSKSKRGGFTMVTAVAHVWFNVFFEGKGPEQQGKPDSSGVFEINWDAMDGLKGSSRKGAKAFDKMSVVWKAVDEGAAVVKEPAEGEVVEQMRPADWRGNDDHSEDFEKKLGLRESDAASAELSRASSAEPYGTSEEVADEVEGVKQTGPNGEEFKVDNKN